MKPAPRAVLLAALTLFAVAAFVSVRPAKAAAAPTVDANEIAVAATEPWLGRQRADGSFVDYVPKRKGVDSYGTAMLGFSILDQGIRLRDDRRIAVGLRALRFGARRALRLANHRSRHARRVVFDNFALASAYNIARRSLASDPRFLAMAPVWRRALRAMGRRVLGTHGYYNFKLVHAAATTELLRTGLRSNKRGATLNNRRRSARWVRRLINHDVPLVARHYDRGKGFRRTTVVSDPPWNPPAYQAFSLLMLTRVIDRMDGAASRSARAALNASLRGMAATMAPDGDVSYLGRSQQQSWTLSSIAYASAVAERDPDPQLRQTASAVGSRALARLRDSYWRDGLGYVMTPSFVTAGSRLAARGVDNYAAGTSYAALTVVALEMAAHEPRIGDGLDLAIPADGQGVRFIGRGQSTLATVRAGDRWFAVSRAPARTAGKNSLYARDLRYDAGLVAFKAPGDSGRWIDVMAQRPRTGFVDSAGPTIRRFGRLWRPVGESMRASARGTITIDGELRDFRGHPAHRRLRMIVAPESCGVRVSFGVHAGERTQYSVFFSRRPDRRGRRTMVLSDERQEVSISPKPRSTKLQSGYSSGADAALVRARMTFKPTKTRRVSVTICPRGMLSG